MKLLAYLLLALVAASAIAAKPAYTSRPLSELAIYPEQQVLATVVSDRQARLAAEVGGRLESLPAEIGASFKRGAVLARLDARQYQIEFKRAQAQLALLQSRVRLSQLQLDQARALNQQAFISADALRQRETERAVLDAELRMAEQGVASAKLALDNTILPAPFDGVVRERLVSVGDTVAPGQAMLEFSAASHRQIRARLAAAERGSVAGAGKLAFVSSNGRVPVKLLRVSPVLDATAQTSDAIFEAASALPAGQAGSLRWHSSRPTLPAAYLQQRGKQLGIFVLEGGKPVFKPVPGALAGRPVELDWPLSTVIIDQGRHGLGVEAARTGKQP
ncbi:efflux RND transporter periplasmic adaptor subunit [Chitinimonas sp. BJYL2]|uniref:efflux RND transporter periplasmic adaptor subunit n=1 Tax=Chitinimonas sp. BJYL2 TaxID=2976696 RepID=UPI0022B3BEBB|nr:efflux RND transporter periplasmic adaptor subunit [Chitinimonas sp. BJYL2]